MTAPIVVEGPGPADLLALVGGSIIATAFTVVVAFWLAQGAPVPARLSGRWWLWPLPTSIAAIVRVTRQRHREHRMSPLEREQEAKTLPLPIPQQRTGGPR